MGSIMLKHYSERDNDWPLLYYANIVGDKKLINYI